MAGGDSAKIASEPLGAKRFRAYPKTTFVAFRGAKGDNAGHLQFADRLLGKRAWRSFPAPADRLAGHRQPADGPADFSDQGVGWKKLGDFTVTSGTVLRVIAWNGATDGQIDADAVQIEPI